MMTLSRYWRLVGLIHIVWAIVLPGRQAKAAALIGAVVAAIGYVATRSRDREGRQPLALLGPFLLPMVAFAGTPQFAFWSLDGRGWIIVAWLVAAAYGVLTTDADSPRGRLWRGAFVCWMCAFWLTIVWDLGMRDLVLFVDRTIVRGCRTDPLATIFSAWEQHPASEHLFLAWRSLGSFETREPYANHVPPYLLAMYAWNVAVRVLTGAPMGIANNTGILLYVFALLGATTLLLGRLGLLRRVHEPGGLITLFLGYGFLITTWRLWIDLFHFNSDNVFPLFAALLVFACACFVPPVRPRMVLASGLLFGALSPVQAPFLVLGAVCIFGQPAANLRDLFARNKLLVQFVLWTMVAAFASAAPPRLLIAWKGYSSYSSSWLMRSGLDGSTQYFDDLFHALWRGHPTSCYVRTPWALFLPMFLPIVAYGAWAFRADHGVPVHPGRLLLFLFTPYVCAWILFGQSLAVHPYLYDSLLYLPAAVMGLILLLTEPIQRRLNGPWLLVVSLFMAALIMTNLTALAQMIVLAKG